MFLQLTSFLICSQLHGIYLYICSVLEPKLLTNQQDDVTNCVFLSRDQVLTEQQKDQIFSGKLANSNGRNFALFYQNSLKFSS